MIDFTQFPSPCYIMEEELLQKEPESDKKRSRQGRSRDYSRLQVIRHVAFISDIPRIRGAFHSKFCV